jgi:hypothetical protein
MEWVHRIALCHDRRPCRQLRHSFPQLSFPVLVPSLSWQIKLIVFAEGNWLSNTFSAPRMIAPAARSFACVPPVRGNRLSFLSLLSHQSRSKRSWKSDHFPRQARDQHTVDVEVGVFHTTIGSSRRLAAAAAAAATPPPTCSGLQTR